MDTDISTGLIVALVTLALWELAWKSVALWKAARNNDKPWYVAILLINSAGILPIIYLIMMGKDKDPRSVSST